MNSCEHIDTQHLDMKSNIMDKVLLMCYLLEVQHCGVCVGWNIYQTQMCLPSSEVRVYSRGNPTNVSYHADLVLMQDRTYIKYLREYGPMCTVYTYK